MAEYDASVYDENYYKSHCGTPYDRLYNDGAWLKFFQGVAEQIVASYRPHRFLDVGCAKGFLVEAMRDLGVAAEGIDISQAALDEVREDIRPFCRRGSSDDKSLYIGRYDVIACIEVVEHLSPEMGIETIRLMCLHADVVLFSSSPSDLTEKTHINVQPLTYWADVFAQCGFALATGDVWASQKLAPHAVVFKNRWLLRLDELANRQQELFAGVQTKLDVLTAASLAFERDMQTVKEMLATIAPIPANQSARGVASQQLDNQLAEAVTQIATLREEHERAKTLIAEMEATKGWKALERLRQLRNRVRFLSRGSRKLARSVRDRGLVATIHKVREKVSQISDFERYHRSVIERVPTALECADMRQQISLWHYTPLISVVVPVYNVSPKWLVECIDSVVHQVYPNWELCLYDDASTSSDTVACLQQAAAEHENVKVVLGTANLGIVGATNKAIDMSQGEYIAFLDNDDVMTLDALFEVVKSLQQTKHDFIYTDEDKLTMDEIYTDPHFKPDWSPDMLLSGNYTSHLGVYRRAVGDQIGWLRAGFEGSQDYDLTLRFTEVTERIHHIPKVLYHWRMIPGSTADDAYAKPYAYESGVRALQDAMRRRGVQSEVTKVVPGHYRVKRILTSEPLVSILIDVTSLSRLLDRCLRSIRDNTSYASYEVIVSVREELADAERALLANWQCKVVDMRSCADDLAGRYNTLAGMALGEVLVFTTDRIEPVNREWLTALVEHGVRAEVGSVSGKLVSHSGKVYAAGVILGVNGAYGYAHADLDSERFGYFGSLVDTRNYSALPRELLVTRKDTFARLDGFREKEYPQDLFSIDYCLRCRETGLLNVYTPYCSVLYDASGGHEPSGSELPSLKEQFGSLLDEDPYYNRNLSVHGDFRIDLERDR